MKKLLYVIITLSLVGCVSAKLATPTQSDVDRVKSKFPDYTLAQLNQGKTLYEQNCGTCHDLKKPTSLSEEKWKVIVPEMVHKVNKRQVKLSEQDQDLILKYLLTMRDASERK